MSPYTIVLCKIDMTVLVKRQIKSQQSQLGKTVVVKAGELQCIDRQKDNRIQNRNLVKLHQLKTCTN